MGFISSLNILCFICLVSIHPVSSTLRHPHLRLHWSDDEHCLSQYCGIEAFDDNGGKAKLFLKNFSSFFTVTTLPLLNVSIRRRKTWRRVLLNHHCQHLAVLSSTNTHSFQSNTFLGNVMNLLPTSTAPMISADSYKSLFDNIYTFNGSPTNCALVSVLPETSFCEDGKCHWKSSTLGVHWWDWGRWYKWN